jgi:hypothetical protein
VAAADGALVIFIDVIPIASVLYIAIPVLFSKIVILNGGLAFGSVIWRTIGIQSGLNE